MPKKPNTQAEFKVFVDEHSPDDSKDIEEQWQKAKKQHRNRQLTKVLIAGAIVIGLIFAILLNTLSHTPSHVLLDDSHPKYSYYQTLFPHIKVEVVKNSDSSEAKLMRGVGVLFSEVVSWLEGNTVPSMKVLLIPDEEAGVNMLGMAVGYYLQSALNGQLDILIHTDSYRELTKANLQLMKKEHP